MRRLLFGLLAVTALLSAQETRGTISGITLSDGERPVVDIRLDVGSITEPVEVSARAPLLITAQRRVQPAQRLVW